MKTRHKALNKRIKSIIKKKWALFLGCIILCSVSVAFIVISITSGSALKDSYNNFFETNNVESASFTTQSELTNSDITELENEFNINIEKNSYFDYENDEKTLRVFNEPKEINKSDIIQGNNISSTNEILINRTFVEGSNKKIGDNISLENEEYKIVGFFTRPDYLTVVKDSSESVSSNNFGVAIISDEAMRKYRDRVTINYSMYSNNTQDFLEIRKVLNDDFTLINFLMKENNNRIMTAIDQANAVTQMAFLYGPFLFTLLMAFVIIILSKILKTEKKEIGILSAFGYSKRELIQFYLKIILLISALGSILGIIIGQFLVQPITKFYANLNNSPHISTDNMFNVILLLTILLVPIILLIGSSSLVIRNYLRQDIISMLNSFTVSNKVRKLNFLRKFNLKNSTKYSFRTLMRNKSRTIVFILGIFIACAIVLIGLIMRTSVNHVLENEFQNNDRINYTYYLQGYEHESENKDGEISTRVNLEYSKTNSLIEMIGIEKNSEFFEPILEDGMIANVEEGFYLSKVASVLWDINPGDSIELINPMTTEKYSLKIEGIIESNQLIRIYSSRENVNTMLNIEDDAYNSIVNDKSINIDQSNVAQVVRNNDLKNSFETIITPVLSVVNVLVIIGVIIGVLVIYMITTMVVEDNQNNISLLKVLGYNAKEISKMMFSINKYIVIFVYLLSIPIMLKFCEIAFIEEAESYKMILPAMLKPSDILFCLIVVLLSYYLGLAITKRKIMKVDMVECLKESRE